MDQEIKAENYQDALKQLESMQPANQWMVIKLSYDLHLILQFEKGIALLSTLAQAEQFNKSYSPTRIESLEKGKIEVTTLSHKEYARFKMAGLLDVDPDQLKAYEDQQKISKEPNEPAF